MPRAQRQFELTELDVDDAGRRLRELGWSVQATGGRVEAREGSQATTRIFGGWFVKASKLPKRLVAEPSQGGLTVTVEETLGFGILDPKLRRKYEEAFAELETALRA